jgi:hypothetical protein
MGILLYSSLSFSKLTRWQSTTQINTTRLIRKPTIHAKRRIHISRITLALMKCLQVLHVFTVKLDKLTVFVNARRSYRFSEDGGAAGDLSELVRQRQGGTWRIHTMITQEHSSRSNRMFLRNFQHTLILEQWASRASQRTIRCDVYALVLAEIDDFLLRQ